MKFVTVTIGGITQQVPEADVSLYLRAGYSVVNESAPVEPVAPAAPVDPAAPSEPAPVEPVADTGKKGKSKE